MRSALLAVAVAGIVLATPGAAGAHVTVSAAGAVQGNYATVTVRVPNEKATAATVKVELLLPADTPVGSASVKPTTGWNVAVEKVPVTVPGVQITEAVSKITWTAGSGAAVQPNQFQEFDVALGPLPVADELVFGALQTYTDGEVVRWVDPPASGPEPDHPAPVLKPAKVGALNDGTPVPAGTPAAIPTTAPADRTLALALAAGALVLAAGGVALGWSGTGDDEEVPVRNEAVEALDVLVGEWELTLTDAWFLESREVRQRGRAAARWLGEAFIELEAELNGDPTWHFVFGRSDPGGQLYALYHDPRPTSRLFRTTFADGEWVMLREDPDMHQRFVGTVTADRIEGQWDASEDGGTTWRKDFSLIFERVRPAV